MNSTAHQQKSIAISSGGPTEGDCVIEEWSSDSMEPAIEFGDIITVRDTKGEIREDGLYMLHYPRARITPPSASHLVADVVKVVRRITRLPDGKLLLAYDNPCSKADEVIQEGDLAKWCMIAGAVSVAQGNKRGFMRMM